MDKFKVGDRVQVVLSKTRKSREASAGMIGKIVTVVGHYNGFTGVQFSAKDGIGGHGLGGLIEDRGWWLHPHELKLIVLENK